MVCFGCGLFAYFVLLFVVVLELVLRVKDLFWFDVWCC